MLPFVDVSMYIDFTLLLLALSKLLPGSSFGDWLYTRKWAAVNQGNVYWNVLPWEITGSWYNTYVMMHLFTYAFR